MSVYVLDHYNEDGAKVMRPVLTREEYLALRNSNKQKKTLSAIRGGDKSKKNQLLQMNYSCVPGDDGLLRGCKTPSNSVGMDIDFVAPAELSAEEQQAWLAGKMTGVPELVLSKREELGLHMLERSASKGYHLVFRRRPELSQEGNLLWASELLGIKYDDGAKDITRVFYTTTADEENLIFLSDEIFEIEAADSARGQVPGINKQAPTSDARNLSPGRIFQTDFKGVPYATIIAEYWRRTGGEPNTGERNKRLHKLAANLRAICDDSEEWLLEIMPRYGLSLQEMKGIIHSACKEPTKGSRVMDEIVESLITQISPDDEDEADEVLSIRKSQLSIKKLPQGVKDSIAAAGPQLAMPIVTAICPCIGALATGVKLDVHGQMRGLNLISYIAGDFASGKGSIDPVVDTWMSEIAELDAIYLKEEEEYNKKKLAAKNKKEQPEDPKLPVRFITFNTTVAKLAERLGNTDGRHAFSFTPEADTVAQKWRSSMCDFSVMLRQSYDGSKYDREARSAEAVNVHIKHLLWNVTMCGTPDALYRVVTNYTDGFQSRIALAQTPDNTFAKLEDKPYVLTSKQAERIKQVAHLLPLMYGEVVLPKLEARGRDWLEKIRLEAMKNDDRVKARERFRTCVTTQRMVCCLMLCKVCEQLIQKYGLSEAEAQLKQHPNLWKEMLQKVQTPAMLDTYDVIADSLLENALYFFRDRIENAYLGRNYVSSVCGERKKHGKNDSIYARLDLQFSFEHAMQSSVAIKGAGVTRNSVQQMLKNWRKQGLVVMSDDGSYRKIS